MTRPGAWVRGTVGSALAMLAIGDPTAAANDEIAAAMARQADGAIVVVASSPGSGRGSTIVLTRIRPDGTLDRTFGDKGWTETRGRGSSTPVAVAVDAAGRIVVLGESRAGDSDFLVARYDPDGRADERFGRDGVVITDAGGFGSDDTARALVLDPDGGLIVAGYAATPDHRELPALVRLRSDGTLDSGFGDGGRVTTPLPFADLPRARQKLYALDRQQDGRLVAGGDVDDRFVVWRYAPDGTLDFGFGNAGVAIIGVSPGAAMALAVAPDDAIVAAGMVTRAERSRFGLVRLGAGGRLDRAFGEDGFVRWPRMPVTSRTTLAREEGGWLVTGDLRRGASQALAVARARSDGRVEDGFGDGLAVMPVPAQGSAADVVPARDGGVVVLGDAEVDRDRDLVLLAYDRAGKPVADFGTGGRVVLDRHEGTTVAAALAALDRGRRRAAPTVAEAACERGLPSSAATVPFGGSGQTVAVGGVMSPYFDRDRFGFYALDDPPPPERRGDATPIELRLSGPTRRRVGEALDVRVAIVNRTSAPVVFLPPVDAGREPFYELYLRDDGDGRVYEWSYRGAGCANVNLVHEGSYRTLAPGEETRAGEWFGTVAQAAVPRPGRYTMWVAYMLCALGTQVLGGRDVVLPDVTTGIHVSNAITVDVAE